MFLVAMAHIERCSVCSGYYKAERGRCPLCGTDGKRTRRGRHHPSVLGGLRRRRGRG
ncbi:hypothetical protein [Halococcus sediminicola]|uniref:hypothetical protein n=1 Tax=Halococcus sediminicola TaxID=1264579 RepID=UPI0012ABA46D|nr:hypothetical protein [Halococcus sediminicola]